MKKSVKLLILALFLISTSCVESVNPLYTEQDIIFDPSILGSWVDEESRETWKISQSGDKKYKLIETDADGRTSEFTAYLLMIDKQTFLNLTEIKSSATQAGFNQTPFLPTHIFIHLSKDDSTIRVSTLEPDWLKTFLEKNPAAIRHQRTNDEILLTASPKELQKFFLTHLETPGAFTKPAVLKQKEGRK